MKESSAGKTNTAGKAGLEQRLVSQVLERLHSGRPGMADGRVPVLRQSRGPGLFVALTVEVAIEFVDAGLDSLGFLRVVRQRVLLRQPG